MKYFLLETDKRNHIPYSINKNRAIDIRFVNKESAYKIPNCSIVDMEISQEPFFPDILDEPLLIVSREFADVIEMYEPNIIFKTVYLLNNESEVHRTYFLPFLEEINCLSEQTTKSRGGTELLRIILKKEVIPQCRIFRIAGYVHPYVIGRLDFVESVLRRDIRGMKLTEIDVAED